MRAVGHVADRYQPPPFFAFRLQHSVSVPVSVHGASLLIREGRMERHIKRALAVYLGNV